MPVNLTTPEAVQDHSQVKVKLIRIDVSGSEIYATFEKGYDNAGAFVSANVPLIEKMWSGAGYASLQTTLTLDGETVGDAIGRVLYGQAIIDGLFAGTVV